MGRGNPCVQCGACCAFFRVSFFWEEANPDEATAVPIKFTNETDDMCQCMKGTDQQFPRCIALMGEIGRQVTCSIYANRSSTCRDFGLHENIHKITVTGLDLVRCNEARKAWSLPPLNRVILSSLLLAPSIRYSTRYANFHKKNQHGFRT